MNANKALKMSELALAQEKQRKKAEEANTIKAHLLEEKRIRTEDVPFRIEEVDKAISAAIKAGKTSTSAEIQCNWGGDIEAEELIKHYTALGFRASTSSEWVPAETDYGDSGEGMHDSYTSHSINLYWGAK